MHIIETSRNKDWFELFSLPYIMYFLLLFFFSQLCWTSSIIISNEIQLKERILNVSSIEFNSSISLSNTVNIYSISLLSINGNGYSIDGQNQFICFNITDSFVTIQNIIITNRGKIANNIGGGFFIHRSTVDITNCYIYNNTAISGGGIYIESGSVVTILKTRIEQNEAEFSFFFYLFLYFKRRKERRKEGRKQRETYLICYLFAFLCMSHDYLFICSFEDPCCSDVSHLYSFNSFFPRLFYDINYYLVFFFNDIL
mmetsp:Transcript_19406/g.23105  ORF Transcript_19406/g.23105 Transcript_19406/m.23105 type:complete len:256 (+) Transcript_19406:52-819(+)